MLNYQKIGMEYSVQQASDMFDEYARLIVLAYYWPYFLAGNADSFKEIGRKFRPMCFR
jgi:hypothetical protein